MENVQNDSPTVDGIALLEAQGIPTDDEDEDDIHFCKKCKQVFYKIEAYLEHKVKHDKFKVAYNRANGDRRMVLPTLVKKEVPLANRPVKTENTERAEGQENTPVPLKPRKRRRKRDPPVDVELIAERSTYICNKCDRKFNREATLKWHMKYDHKTRLDDDDEEGEDEEGEENDADDESGDMTFIVKQEPVRRRSRGNDNSERPYVCEICNMAFKEMAVLKAHAVTHSSVREFKCSMEGCPYAFKTKGSLVRHLRRHTGERPYTCEQCGRKFAESGALTRHMRSRNPCTAKTDADLPRYGKRWTYVPNIPAVVGSDKSGDGMAPMVPGEMVVVMTQGENGEQIITEAQVVSNNETVSSLGETPMEEGEVPESEVGDFVITSDLENLSPTQCRVCKEECLDLEALRGHLRTHLADMPFRCGLCHFTSEVREELSSHMQSKHQNQLKGVDASILMPPTESSAQVRSQPASKDNREAQVAVKQLLELPQYPNTDVLTETVSARAISRCPVCSRAFRGTSYLRQHMKSHTGDRPHSCPICHKSFVTKDALNKHLIVHTDERNFKCGECGKLFKRIGHVKEHLKIHNSDRPFPCTVCEKSFKTNNALKVHVRTHTDCFPYECRTCHRQFREKGSLHRHRRIHTGERPFRCPRCGRGFAEHGTLNRHLKAKVRCTPHPGMSQVEESLTEQDSQDMEQVEVDTDVPTVLAEFSSVVADTQQYIVADHLGEGDQQTTEYVVLHTDLTSDEIQNVEIVTDGEIDTDAILAGDDKSYVVVDEAGNSLRIIDSSMGLTVAALRAEADETVTMIPASESDSGSVTVKTDAGSIAMVGDDVSDAVQRAMLVADVVDSNAEVVGEIPVTLGSQGGITTVMGQGDMVGDHCDIAGQGEITTVEGQSVIATVAE